jgi:alkylation response protein AidB-like acyl-CoA dehydrogenase
MPNLLVDQRDVQFVLFEQFNIERLTSSERYREFNRDVCEMILSAAQKFAENELWPNRARADIEGVQLENGHAKAPACFHEIYRKFCEDGWASLCLEAEIGGQGSPYSLYCGATEHFLAANLAFMAYPGLTLGAAHLIHRHGAPWQKETFLERMVNGEWGGTMCLTEPQAGSDVGALRTRAYRRDDGAYSIVGNKIFISAGDHDLTENIVHLVLARLEGAPAGTRGISLFIVPKKRIEGDQLVSNDISTSAVEKKLGLHGSATCQLNFGDHNDCIGYLIGEENGGMRIMFDMMNEARLGVGLQGLAQASGAYRQALRYAQERLQGPSYKHFKQPDAPKVPIIEHPDVRRMILWMKSVTEGMRSLLYFAGFCEDLAQASDDQGEAQKHKDLIEILIPVCKSWASDMGFRVAETAIQVFGGYGYCREYPVEQFLRDVKITSIYEGTNGIQALDLIGRKLALKGGALFQAFIGFANEILARARDREELKDIVSRCEQARDSLIQVTTHFAMEASKGNLAAPILFATPYQELFGDAAVGLMLLWQAEVASRRLSEIYQEKGVGDEAAKDHVVKTSSNAAFYVGKIASARFFAHSILALSPGKAEAILTGDLTPLQVPQESLA